MNVPPAPAAYPEGPVLTLQCGLSAYIFKRFAWTFMQTCSSMRFQGREAAAREDNLAETHRH